MTSGRSWGELSQELTGIVKEAGPSVVRVDAGRRNASSGVAWSQDGIVVTASHGVDEDEVEVALASGETAQADVVGRDPSTDLAVLRTRVTSLVPPRWSDAPLEVGQLVFSVTRPGRGPRAGIGLVSRLGDAWRTSSGGKLDRYVELELGLHPGFSGGLVLDASGRGIGIAAAGLVRGTPLAIPFTTLTRVVTAIVEHGGVRRGYLGVATLPVKVPAAVGRLAAQQVALLVTAIDDESPAARAGLMVGDLLLAIDGTSLQRMGELLTVLDEDRIGHAARARVARGGVLHEVEVTIGARGGAREGGAQP